jgi:hypothetical protein
MGKRGLRVVIALYARKWPMSWTKALGRGGVRLSKCVERLGIGDDVLLSGVVALRAAEWMPSVEEYLVMCAESPKPVRMVDWSGLRRASGVHSALGRVYRSSNHVANRYLSEMRAACCGD